MSEENLAQPAVVTPQQGKVPLFHGFVDGLGRVADNVWAFLLFVGAGAIAVFAHFGHDKDLMTFASSVALTGAALFHGKRPGD